MDQNVQITEQSELSEDQDLLKIEELEDRVSFDVHGACACTTSCGCTSSSCVVWF